MRGERQVAVNGEVAALRRRVAELEGEVAQARASAQRLKYLETQVRKAQKVESLGTLAGTVAHDFNNLLVAILGNADLGARRLRNGHDPEPCLSNIREAAQRAGTLCRQFLAYSGRERSVRVPQDLNEVVRRMTQLMQAAVSSRIELAFRLSDDLPLIDGDDSQLGQVVMNLITNAAEAIGPNHGRISIRTKVAMIDSDQPGFLPRSPPPGRHAVIEVSDNGRGMGPKTRSMAFDPFFTSKQNGHGLGLSAVLGIVRSHCGAIRVHSTLGKGTTFTVVFPLPRARKRTPVPATRQRRLTPGFGTVLVVDDERGVRQLACEVLREEGYRAVEADNGDLALRLLTEQGEAIRAVLLDVTMPRRDGLSTLRELRRNRPNLPVILSSGRGIPIDGSRDQHLRFLSKPYPIESLLLAVEDAIGTKGAATSEV